MSELNLSPQKQKEYDALMAEIEAELSKIPPEDGKTLSCARNRPYQEIAKKYLPKIREIMEASE